MYFGVKHFFTKNIGRPPELWAASASTHIPAERADASGMALRGQGQHGGTEQSGASTSGPPPHSPSSSLSSSELKIKKISYRSLTTYKARQRVSKVMWSLRPNIFKYIKNKCRIGAEARVSVGAVIRKVGTRKSGH